MSKETDRYDHAGVAWYNSRAQEGETCAFCKRPARRGTSVLTERVLPGVNIRPQVLHPRRCWLEHLRTTNPQAMKGPQAHAG